MELSSPPRFVLGRQSCGTSFLSPFNQLSVWHEYGPTDCAHLLFAEPQQKHAAAVQQRAEMAAMLASPATACVYRGTLVHSVAIGKVKVSRTSSSVAEDSRIPIIQHTAVYERRVQAKKGEERAGTIHILHPLEPERTSRLSATAES